MLQGGERTKTVEEVAEGEKARLERLETERIKRMRGIGGGSDEDDFADEDGVMGGYRARRQKRKRQIVEHGPSGDFALASPCAPCCFILLFYHRSLLQICLDVHQRRSGVVVLRARLARSAREVFLISTDACLKKFKLQVQKFCS